MSSFWDTRGETDGWEEQLYPDADEEEGVEVWTTE